ncbi:MAG TPA: PLP-dependent aminotransferase family protein [Gemmatimonadaceae bacterium]|nr:PLP-dependent aminotransferase family protein [Gemmatimonadaceae bacterium]
MLLDPRSAAPLYRQLYDGLREAIVGGRLRPGARLPAARALGSDLALSRNTVEQAYEQLHAEGYLDRHPRRGTFVSDTMPDDVLHARPNSREPRRIVFPARSSAPPRRLLSSRGAAIADVALPAGVNTFAPPRPFRPGVPALDAFPMALWSRLSARHWQRAGRRHLAYGHSAGYQPLREAIAQHVGAARGVRCTPEQVIIVGGSQQALALATRLLLDPGDSVWMEEPGYLGARAAFIASEARIVPVPVDEEGLDVAAGEHAAPDARLAFVTPSHQHPLGSAMSIPRRMALLAWARRADAWILEDDYDSEIRYEGRPLPAMQGLDSDGRVLYLGTFSKTVFPALRLGYVIVPTSLVDAFVTARLIVDRHSSVVEQAILADFISEGHYARHIRRMRTLYAERQNALLDALHPFSDVVDVQPTRAGLNVLAWLPVGVDDRAIARKAESVGIEAPPLSPFALRPLARGALILNFSGYDEMALRSAASRLGASIREVIDRHSNRQALGA